MDFRFKKTLDISQLVFAKELSKIIMIIEIVLFAEHKYLIILKYFDLIVLNCT